jgi:hypothetical protein
VRLRCAAGHRTMGGGFATHRRPIQQMSRKTDRLVGIARMRGSAPKSFAKSRNS